MCYLVFLLYIWVMLYADCAPIYFVAMMNSNLNGGSKDEHQRENMIHCQPISRIQNLSSYYYYKHVLVVLLFR